MAMCVYKYVFNKHVIYGGDGGGGGPARIQVFIIEGRLVLSKALGTS